MKNDNQIFIEKMNIGQINEVLEIERLSFVTPWSRESFMYDLTENENAIYLSAIIDGYLVGYGGMWIICDEAHIMNIAVHPNYRRRGIGATILQSIIEISLDNNLKSMTLEVRKSNNSAIELYNRFGFYECGVRKGYYEDTNEDAIIMWKTL